MIAWPSFSQSFGIIVGVIVIGGSVFGTTAGSFLRFGPPGRRRGGGFFLGARRGRRFGFTAGAGAAPHGGRNRPRIQSCGGGGGMSGPLPGNGPSSRGGISNGGGRGGGRGGGGGGGCGGNSKRSPPPDRSGPRRNG